MNREPFAEGEYYHIYNQGIDKRDITSDSYDLNRLIQSLVEFNTEDPIGSIFENSFQKGKDKSDKGKDKNSKRLIDIVCYCINPNHLHLLVRAVTDNGIPNFMHRFFTGYTKYFNQKYKRRGALFQGTYKSKHVTDNNYLLHLSAYVNFNDRVHRLGSLTSKSSCSSWDFYVTGNESVPGLVSGEEIILDQFDDRSEYKVFAEDSLVSMLEEKNEEEEFKNLLFEE